MPEVVVITAEDIEDTTLHEYYPTRNYGGSGDLGVGERVGLGDTRGVVRIADSAIPKGTILQCEFSFFPNVNMTLTGNAILPAATWVEGTGLGGGVVVGTASWNHLVHDTVPWPGSAGCSTAGVDYSAADESTKVVIGGVMNTWDLPVAWFDIWATTNNGFLIRSDATWWRIIESTEAGANTPYFTITYEPPPGKPLYTPVTQPFRDAYTNVFPKESK